MDVGNLCQTRYVTNMLCDCEIMRHLCISVISLIIIPRVDSCHLASSAQVKPQNPLGKCNSPVVQ